MSPSSKPSRDLVPAYQNAPAALRNQLPDKGDRALLVSIDASKLVGLLRDRAGVAILIYAAARLAGII